MTSTPKFTVVLAIPNRTQDEMLDMRNGLMKMGQEVNMPMFLSVFHEMEPALKCT